MTVKACLTACYYSSKPNIPATTAQSQISCYYSSKPVPGKGFVQQDLIRVPSSTDKGSGLQLVVMTWVCTGSKQLQVLLEPKLGN